MADPDWERYAAGTGLVAAVLLAAQEFLAPFPPSYGEFPPSVARYYVLNAQAIRVQILVMGLAGVLFLWFLGSLRAHLRRFEADVGRISAVAFGAGIAATGPVAVGALAGGTAAHLADSRVFARLATLTQAGVPSLGAVPPLHDLRLLSYPLAWFGVAPLLAATAVVAARGGAFPRWHMNATYVLAVLALGAGLSLLIDTGLFAPGGAYDVVLFGLFVVWLGVTSWLVMQALAPPAAESTTTLEQPPASGAPPP